MARDNVNAEPVEIGGMSVKPGERATIDLPIAKLYTHTEMTMPVHVVNGRRPGPRLFVCAAIHGDEINGVEIIRRLLRHSLLKNIRGALIALPVVNLYGFIHQSRYLPDRRDLNRSFPGSSRGSLASRMAKLFMDEILANSTHGIDIHTGSYHRFNLPHIRACLDCEETRRLAGAFGAPVVIDSRIRDGSLRQAAAERGVPLLLFEGGESSRFHEPSIKLGLKGIISVMREIGMLPAKKAARPGPEPQIVEATTWVRAHISGIINQAVPIGTRVSEGEPLGRIVDPFGETREEVVSTVDGIVIGRRNLPPVYEGDAIFHIATSAHAPAIEAALDELKLGAQDDPLFRANPE